MRRLIWTIARDDSTDARRTGTAGVVVLVLGLATVTIVRTTFRGGLVPVAAMFLVGYSALAIFWARRSSPGNSVVPTAVSGAVAPTERALLIGELRGQQRFVVATDRRLLLTERAAGRAGTQPEFSTPHDKVAEVVIGRTSAHDSGARRMTIRTADAAVEFDLDARDADALVRILERRIEGRLGEGRLGEEAPESRV